MKKILMLVAIAVFMFGVAGQAAAFVAGDLIRVVFQSDGTVEYATELGPVSATSAFTTNVVYNTSNFLTSTFGTTFSNLYVGYFITDGTTSHAWTSGPLTGQVSGSRQNNAFEAAAANVIAYYASIAGGAQSATGSQTFLNSYISSMDKGINSGTNGVMNGFIPLGNAEASLAALATTGYVDQELYYYGNSAVAASGVAIADIRTYADGHTELNPVPIPAAVYLLGSGLLGLIGIRRRMAA